MSINHHFFFKEKGSQTYSNLSPSFYQPSAWIEISETLLLKFFGIVAQAPQHPLKSCPNFHVPRSHIWPSTVEFDEKLWVPVAAFLQIAGFTLQASYYHGPGMLKEAESNTSLMGRGSNFMKNSSGWELTLLGWRIFLVPHYSTAKLLAVSSQTSAHIFGCDFQNIFHNISSCFCPLPYPDHTPFIHFFKKRRR